MSLERSDDSGTGGSKLDPPWRRRSGQSCLSGVDLDPMALYFPDDSRLK